MLFLQFKQLGSAHLPVLFAIVFTTMLGFTYSFSVWRGDVDPVFPYISAAGDNRPEACMFRYSLVVELNRSSDLLLKSFNRLNLYSGLLGATGMFLVANFQETAVIQVHLFGAFLWMYPLFCGIRIAKIRGVMAIASVCLFFMAFGFGWAAASTFHSVFPNLPTPRPWTHKLVPMPGYNLHCISAIAEWSLALLHMSFLLSFSREFEKIRVQLGVQSLVSHLDQSPLWTSIADLSGSP